MRIDPGDYVMLRSEAVLSLLEQGHDNLGGQVAEVVDMRVVPDGVDLTLRFDGVKTLITDIPIDLVHSVGIC